MQSGSIEMQFTCTAHVRAMIVHTAGLILNAIRRDVYKYKIEIVELGGRRCTDGCRITTGSIEDSSRVAGDWREDFRSV